MTGTTSYDISGLPDAVIDGIVARFSGDMRGAVEALLLVNEYLELELNRAHCALDFDSRTERHRRCTLH